MGYAYEESLCKIGLIKAKFTEHSLGYPDEMLLAG
jgi:hypothetical protein